MTLIIKKVKVKDASAEVMYFQENDGLFTEVLAKYPHPPHRDLHEAMGILTKHLAVLCDLREADDILASGNFEEYDLTKISQLKVTGISIGGDDEFEGVVITGQKKLNNGKVINLNTPFTPYTDENDPYPYEGDLYNDISRCLYEIEEYMGGKWAVRQLEMNFEVDVNKILEAEEAER